MILLYNVCNIGIHLLNAFQELSGTFQVEEALLLHREFTSTLVKDEVNIKIGR